MVDLIIYAIPAFVLLLVVELLSFKYARDEELVGYESRVLPDVAPPGEPAAGDDRAVLAADRDATDRNRRGGRVPAPRPPGARVEGREVQIGGPDVLPRLTTPTVVRDPSGAEPFGVEPEPFDEVLRRALAEEAAA